jgi:hypothetical protein
MPRVLSMMKRMKLHVFPRISILISYSIRLNRYPRATTGEQSRVQVQRTRQLARVIGHTQIGNGEGLGARRMKGTKIAGKHGWREHCGNALQIRGPSRASAMVNRDALYTPAGNRLLANTVRKGAPDGGFRHAVFGPYLLSRAPRRRKLQVPSTG